MNYSGSDYLRELLRILVRSLGILEKNDVSCYGVTLAQCHTIVEIGRAQKISLIDLADLLGLDKSTMSRTINNLVNLNLVNRETDSDNRRYISIQLTDKGIEVFRNIEDSMNDYYSKIFNSIASDKRDKVLESLELLVAAIKENK
ncbi:MarR family transcriptional regulator [Lachnospiraceae bacterium MD1]|uniref:MarR family transcriptional regulator n=1 Tax=Variimorphobacter saccharofermentans TaxID=2755051 RepID=A0A839JZY1_9FIRM|nr:MarR family transcriptional regulator [Variimorphobacter saccharofermentans]MBB2182964.1 MarR family transcriptional regulator [Variimorphobacter saccharofermentans]